MVRAQHTSPSRWRCRWPGPQRRVRDGSATPGEQGMVTAELAMGSILVAAMALFVIWLGGVVVTLQQAHDGAVQIARQQARGDTEAVAQAEELLADHCTTHTSRDGEYITVTVLCRSHRLADWLPSPEVSGKARIQAEPGQS